MECSQRTSCPSCHQKRSIFRTALLTGILAACSSSFGSTANADEPIMLPPAKPGVSRPVLMLGGIEPAKVAATKSEPAKVMLVSSPVDEKVVVGVPLEGGPTANSVTTSTAQQTTATFTVVANDNGNPGQPLTLTVVAEPQADGPQAGEPTTRKTQGFKIHRVEGVPLGQPPHQGPPNPGLPFQPQMLQQARPHQDGPGQDRPGQDRPGQDRPGQDRPGQDRPGQHGPEQRRSNQGPQGPDREQRNRNQQGPGPNRGESPERGPSRQHQEMSRPNHGPQDRGPQDRGPQNRGPLNQRSDGRPDNRGPDNRGPDNRGADNRGPDNRGPDNGPQHQMGPNNNSMSGNRMMVERRVIGAPGMDPMMSLPGSQPSMDRMMESPMIKKMMTLMQENMELKSQLKIQQIQMESQMRIRELEMQLRSRDQHEQHVPQAALLEKQHQLERQRDEMEMMRKKLEAERMNLLKDRELQNNKKSSSAKPNSEQGSAVAKTATVTVIGDKLDSKDPQPKQIELRVIEDRDGHKIGIAKDMVVEVQGMKIDASAHSKATKELEVERDQLLRKLNELEHRSRTLEARVKELAERRSETRPDAKSDAKSESKSQAKPDSKADSKSESKSESKSRSDSKEGKDREKVRD